MIRYEPTLVDLTSNFFILCTNMKFKYITIHSGWSLNIHEFRVAAELNKSDLSVRGSDISFLLKTILFSCGPHWKVLWQTVETSTECNIS